MQAAQNATSTMEENDLEAGNIVKPPLGADYTTICVNVCVVVGDGEWVECKRLHTGGHGAEAGEVTEVWDMRPSGCGFAQHGDG